MKKTIGYVALFVLGFLLFGITPAHASLSNGDIIAIYLFISSSFALICGLVVAAIWTAIVRKKYKGNKVGFFFKVFGITFSALEVVALSMYYFAQM